MIKGLKIVQDYLGKPKIVTNVLKMKRGKHKVHIQKRQESRQVMLLVLKMQKGT